MENRFNLEKENLSHWEKQPLENHLSLWETLNLWETTYPYGKHTPSGKSTYPHEKHV